MRTEMIKIVKSGPLNNKRKFDKISVYILNKMYIYIFGTAGFQGWSHKRVGTQRKLMRPFHI